MKSENKGAQAPETWRPDRLDRLEQIARELEPVKVAVVCPQDAPSLNGALESQRRGLIEAVLVGDAAKIRRAADDTGVDLGATRIVEADTPEAAAGAAVDLALAGKVGGLMKGAVKTGILMHAIISNKAMHTGRRISHVFAAAICKMADRGTISGADIDGPLAMDLAVSPKAAAIKGIVSPVAGRADILIVPDLVSGNILVKDLDYLANAETAGIVMGAAVPIALTSRADSVEQRCASAALVCLVAAANKTGIPAN